MSSSPIWCNKIHLTNDNGKIHFVLLEGCIYHPESPVNLISTRRLADKFLDSNGNPNEETIIESRYSNHTLTWCCGKYNKTFPTPVSGFPEHQVQELLCRSKTLFRKLLLIPLNMNMEKLRHTIFFL